MFWTITNFKNGKNKTFSISIVKKIPRFTFNIDSPLSEVLLYHEYAKYESFR